MMNGTLNTEDCYIKLLDHSRTTRQHFIALRQARLHQDREASLDEQRELEQAQALLEQKEDLLVHFACWLRNIILNWLARIEGDPSSPVCEDMLLSSAHDLCPEMDDDEVWFLSEIVEKFDLGRMAEPKYVSDLVALVIRSLSWFEDVRDDNDEVDETFSATITELLLSYMIFFDGTRKGNKLIAIVTSPRSLGSSLCNFSLALRVAPSDWDPTNPVSSLRGFRLPVSKNLAALFQSEGKDFSLVETTAGTCELLCGMAHLMDHDCTKPVARMDATANGRVAVYPMLLLAVGQP